MEQFYSSEEPLVEALERFIVDFSSDPRRVLKSKPYMGWDYGSDTVFTTWEISFASLQKRAPDAARIFEVAAFFGRIEFPQSLGRLVGSPEMSGK